MRRKRVQPDSFGLLIDTMCNAIGGLVLIAVVVAILGSAAGPTKQRVEDLDERIEIGRDTLNELENEQIVLEERLENFSGESSATDKELLATEERISTLRAELQRVETDLFRERRLLEEFVGKAAEARVADPAELARDELARADEIDDQIRETRGKIRNLSDQLDRLEKAKIREIETPVENYITDWNYIVVKGGRAFPFTQTDVIDNNPPDEFFEVVFESASDIQFKPKGPGLSLSGNRLTSFIERVSESGAHCIIGLYPDSFGCFRDLKNTLLEANVDYGVDFFPSQGMIGFTSSGGEAVGGF